MKEYQKQLRSECEGQVPSIATIDRILARRKISYKAVSLVPPKRNSPETIEKRKKYATKFSRLELNSNFVFIDEFGCSIALRRGRARSKIGSPAIVFGPSRAQNMSVIAAIDKDGPIYHLCKFGSMNQAQYKLFLETLIGKLYSSKDNVLICDNLSVHKAQEVKDFLIERRIKCVYLPPYSPMLNPIEECFSKVKNDCKIEI